MRGLYRSAKSPFGVMVHHFYDENHCRGQGAISSQQFADIIDFLGRDRILPATEWMGRYKKKVLRDDELCITFDDVLLCQYDIALPVLEDYSLTAFWFVYSSILADGIEMLEMYRKFRTMCFEDVEDFYGFVA